MLTFHNEDSVAILLLILFVIWYSLLTTRRTIGWYMRVIKLNFKKLIRKLK